MDLSFSPQPIILAGLFTWSPCIGAWLANTLRPGVDRALADAGHIPGPPVFRKSIATSPRASAWASPRRASPTVTAICDPKPKAEFGAKLAAEPDFAKSPTARLQWFYRRTKFYDDRHLRYPVGLERDENASLSETVK